MRRTATAFLTATMLAIGASQIASAADLPRRQPAYMPPPPPAYTWTGCYIGVNIGGAWGNIDATDVTTGRERLAKPVALPAAARSAAITK